jgi:hypothetical protein
VCSSKPSYSFRTVKRVIGIEELREIKEFGSDDAVQSFMDAKGFVAPEDCTRESLRW